MGLINAVNVGIKILMLPDNKIKEANQQVINEFKKTSKIVANEFISAFRTMEREGIRFGLAMGGISAMMGGISKQIVQITGQFEQFRVKLETVLGDAYRGREAFNWAVKYAAITPFNVQDVVNATTTVTAYGAEYRRVVPMVAALAAGMGKRLEDTALVVSKAWSGSLNGFKSLRNEYGISTAMLIKYGAAEGQNVSIATRTNAQLERARNAMQRIIDLKFGTAIERQFNTLFGAWSNFQDALQRIAMQMGEIFLPVLTGAVKLLTQMAGIIEKLSPEIKSFLAVTITSLAGIAAAMSFGSLVGGTLSGLKALSVTIDKIYKAWRALTTAQAASGLAMAGNIANISKEMERLERATKAVAATQQTIPQRALAPVKLSDTRTFTPVVPAVTPAMYSGGDIAAIGAARKVAEQKAAAASGMSAAIARENKMVKDAWNAQLLAQTQFSRSQAALDKAALATKQAHIRSSQLLTISSFQALEKAMLAEEAAVAQYSAKKALLEKAQTDYAAAQSQARANIGKIEAAQIAANEEAKTAAMGLGAAERTAIAEAEAAKLALASAKAGGTGAAVSGLAAVWSRVGASIAGANVALAGLGSWPLVIIGLTVAAVALGWAWAFSADQAKKYQETMDDLERKAQKAKSQQTNDQFDIYTGLLSKTSSENKKIIDENKKVLSQSIEGEEKKLEAANRHLKILKEEKKVLLDNAGARLKLYPSSAFENRAMYTKQVAVQVSGKPDDALNKAIKDYEAKSGPSGKKIVLTVDKSKLSDYEIKIMDKYAETIKATTLVGAGKDIKNSGVKEYYVVTQEKLASLNEEIGKFSKNIDDSKKNIESFGSSTKTALDEIAKTAGNVSKGELLNTLSKAGLTVDDIRREDSEFRNRAKELRDRINIYKDLVSKAEEAIVLKGTREQINRSKVEYDVVASGKLKERLAAQTSDYTKMLVVDLKKFSKEEQNVIKTYGRYVKSYSDENIKGVQKQAEGFKLKGPLSGISSSKPVYQFVVDPSKLKEMQSELAKVNTEIQITTKIMRDAQEVADDFIKMSDRASLLKDFFTLSTKTENIKEYKSMADVLLKEMNVTRTRIAEIFGKTFENIDVSKLTDMLNIHSKNFVKDDNIRGMIKLYLDQYGMLTDTYKKINDKISQENKAFTKSVMDSFRAAQNAYNEHLARQQESGKVEIENKKTVAITLEKWTVWQLENELKAMQDSLGKKSTLKNAELAMVLSKEAELRKAKEAAAKAPSKTVSIFEGKIVPGAKTAEGDYKETEREYTAQEKLKDAVQNLSRVKTDSEIAITKIKKQESDKRDQINKEIVKNEENIVKAQKDLNDRTIKAKRVMLAEKAELDKKERAYNEAKKHADIVFTTTGIRTDMVTSEEKKAFDEQKRVYEKANIDYNNLRAGSSATQATIQKNQEEKKRSKEALAGLTGSVAAEAELSKARAAAYKKVAEARKGVMESNLKDMEEKYGEWLVQEEEMDQNNLQRKIANLYTVREAYSNAIDMREIDERKGAKKILDIDKDILKAKKALALQEVEFRKNINDALLAYGESSRTEISKKLAAGEDVQGKLVRATDNILKMKLANLDIEKQKELQNIGDTAQHRAMLDLKYQTLRQGVLESERNYLQGELEKLENGIDARAAKMEEIAKKYEGSKPGGTNSPLKSLEQMSEESAAFFTDQSKPKAETDRIKLMIQSLDSQIKPMEKLSDDLGTLSDSVLTLNSTMSGQGAAANMLGINAPGGKFAPGKGGINAMAGINNLGGPGMMVPAQSPTGMQYSTEVQAQIKAAMTSFIPRQNTTMADLMKDKKFSTSEELKATLDILNKSLTEKQPNVAPTQTQTVTYNSVFNVDAKKATPGVGAVLAAQDFATQMGALAYNTSSDELGRISGMSF